MDVNAVATSGVSAGIVAILYALYKVFKHSRCTSTCCGWRNSMNVSLSSPFLGESK